MLVTALHFQVDHADLPLQLYTERGSRLRSIHHERVLCIEQFTTYRLETDVPEPDSRIRVYRLHFLVHMDETLVKSLSQYIQMIRSQRKGEIQGREPGKFLRSHGVVLQHVPLTIRQDIMEAIKQFLNGAPLDVVNPSRGHLPIVCLYR